MNDNDRKIIASAYLDGGLDQEEREWFENDLVENPQTQPHLDDIRRLRDWVRVVPPAAPPHSVAYNFQRVKARMSESAPLEFMPGRILRFVPPVLAAAAAIVVLAVVLMPRERESSRAVEVAWSPDPDLSVSTFRSGGAEVIWVSGYSAYGSGE